MSSRTAEFEAVKTDGLHSYLRNNLDECGYQQTNLSVNVENICIPASINPRLQLVTNELVYNCAEKEHSDPIRIEIHLFPTEDNGRRYLCLTVEDNITYDDKTLRTLLKNLNTKSPKRIAKSQDRVSEGGIGIKMVRNFASSANGDLEYSANTNGSIKATLKWQDCL